MAKSERLAGVAAVSWLQAAASVVVEVGTSLMESSSRQGAFGGAFGSEHQQNAEQLLPS